MPGYQTMKTKYGTEAKPFFGSKNFEISTPYVKAELNPSTQPPADPKNVSLGGITKQQI